MLLFRAVCSATEASPPPPLDAGWLRGGGTSHFVWDAAGAPMVDSSPPAGGTAIETKVTAPGLVAWANAHRNINRKNFTSSASWIPAAAGTSDCAMEPCMRAKRHLEWCLSAGRECPNSSPLNGHNDQAAGTAQRHDARSRQFNPGVKRLPHATPYPDPPAALRQSRGWLLKALGRSYLRLSGWRIEGAWPEAPKYVAVVAPHTSNWDFPLGLAVAFSVELRVSWLGKHTMFRRPFKSCLMWLGGIPVNRSAAHGVVGGCVSAFEAAPALMLVVAPEGTRSGVSQWKSGFYYIARRAGVPIMPIGFDYREHVVHLMPLFQPSGNLEQDLPLIQARLSHVHGYRERPTRNAEL